MRTVLPALCLLVLTLPASADDLRVLAWNVESGTPRPDDPSEGSDPETIADQLKQLADYDLVGLSEVRPAAAKQFVDALSAGAGETFLSVNSATGMDDRLVLTWNSKRLQLLESYELHRFGDWMLNSMDDNGNWRHRSPLVGHFRDRDTGTEFLGMVNHLARGDESVRNRQAIGLRNWAAEQKLPIVAIGDFNFDFDFHTQQGNRAYQGFTEGDHWEWVKPELVDSNWADTDPRLPPTERKDQYPDSILDFVFVAGPAKGWEARSWVVVREGDFPDTGETSDHRPVAAAFDLPDGDNGQGRAGYPQHWWTAVPEEGAPDWEILPQAAGPGEVILSKRNELGLLSNFAATPFTYRGQRYASVEGFWQAMLYPEGPDDFRTRRDLEWKFTREQVEQMSGFEAKAAGDLAQANMKKIGCDLVTFEENVFQYRPEEPGEHYRLIVEATNEKVRQNPEVEKVLRATGDLVLKPDHHQEEGAPAAWRYCEILTAIRGELEDEHHGTD